MAIGSLTIGSNVDCDFVYIANAVPDNVADLHYEPIWDAHSRFLAKFDHSLMAGNLSAGGTPPTSWAIYRQEVGKSKLDYLGDYDGKVVTCYDYMVRNNTKYVYHSFARTESSLSEDAASNQIAPDWGGWTLITLDPTDDPNTFVPHEIFMFQYNLEVSDMSNNTVFNKLETFTKYPYIQRSGANHMSGQLRGLLGGVDSQGRYFDTIQQAEAMRALTTDTRRKVLKDLKGHIFEIELSNSMTFSVESNIAFEPYYVTFSWTEVASTDELKVVVMAEDYDADYIIPGIDIADNDSVLSGSFDMPMSEIYELRDKVTKLEEAMSAPIKSSRIVQDDDIILDFGDANTKNDTSFAPHANGDD